jgi:enterochelin esterase-like enzyme
MFRTLAIVLTLSIGVAADAHAQNVAPAKKGTVEKVSVHGAALQGNLEGDSPERTVYIYLPPSYASNRNRRYPVVYLLHGYGLTAERWMSFTKLADAADKDIAAGTMREMILVNPDAFTKYSGSMYSSSPTTGDWESYIADDLVSYVDRHFRTIANRMSRGPWRTLDGWLRHDPDRHEAAGCLLEPLHHERVLSHERAVPDKWESWRRPARRRRTC